MRASGGKPFEKGLSENFQKRVICHQFSPTKWLNTTILYCKTATFPTILIEILCGAFSRESDSPKARIPRIPRVPRVSSTNQNLKYGRNSYLLIKKRFLVTVPNQSAEIYVICPFIFALQYDTIELSR